MSDSLQALLDRAIARGAAPGLVACAFDRNGTFASAASGTSSIETGSAMSINTTIWLASTSKTLVSLAALVLVERDGFDLDSHEELVKVVPELGKGYPGSRVWELFDGKDENGEWRFKQAQKGITLRHLLTHTSGFAYDFVAEETAWLAQQAEQAGMPFEPGSIRSYNIPRLFEAGESWCYGCSPGYIAIFIMRKTGVPLRQALWELILKPLGVAPDTLDIFVTPRMELNRADIAMRNSTSFLTPKPFPFTMPNCENETPEGYIPFADGPFSGTALAFADVLRSFLNGSAPGSNGEKPLLSPKMWRTATQDNIGLRGMSIPQGPMFKSFVPQKINSVERLATPKNKGVNDSLGWTPLQTLHHRNERQYSSHDDLPSKFIECQLDSFLRQRSVPSLAFQTTTGLKPGSLEWVGVANSYFFVDPVSGVGAFLSAQFLPGGDPAMLKLRDEVWSWVYQQASGKTGKAKL